LVPTLNDVSIGRGQIDNRSEFDPKDEAGPREYPPKAVKECLQQVGGFSEDEIEAIVDRHPTVPGFEIITLSQ
jgi:hypothetical protein